MFHAVSPEDPLTAIQLTQANFSWTKPDSQSNPEVEDTAPTGSLYLHNLNLTVKKVCSTLQMKALTRLLRHRIII